MWGICTQEFKSLFRTWKSISVIILFLLVSFLSGKFFSSNEALFINNNEDIPIFVSSIRAIVLFFGVLFVMALSHDCMNKEIEYQTIRLLVTKCARFEIVFGKFFGILFFWIVCLFISFCIVCFFARQFYILEFVKLLSFLSYVIAVAILLSTFVNRPSYTMFLGVVIGLLFPIIGVWSLFDYKISMLKYIFPYYYIVEGSWYTIVPLLYSFLFISITILRLRGRDL